MWCVLYSLYGYILAPLIEYVKFDFELLRFIQKGLVLIVFIDKYLKICEHFGEAPTTVLNNIGISKSAYSNWVKGGEPANRTKKDIAEYFGITVEELVSGQIKTAPAAKTESDEIAELLQEFRDNKDLRTLFSISKKATPEQLRQYVSVIKALRGSDED